MLSLDMRIIMVGAPIAVLAIALALNLGPHPVPMSHPVNGSIQAINNSLLNLRNFTVYYGDEVNSDLLIALNHYQLVILQPWALTPSNLSLIKAIKIAYIDLGEYDNSTWPQCRVNLTGIVIGYDADWGQPIINASSPRWVNYTLCEVREALASGFNGVLFDDVDDAIDYYPGEASGVINIIKLVSENYPNALIGVNRGFQLARNLSPYIQFVLYEDYGTYYNFTTNDYQYLDASQVNRLINTTNYLKSLGLMVLALGYSPLPCDSYSDFVASLVAREGVPYYVGGINLTRLPTTCIIG